MWIDEAGIRAGHKWRNEIADGIQVSSCVWCLSACMSVSISVVVLVAELLVFPSSLVSSL